MERVELVSESPDATMRAAADVVAALRAGDVVLISGDVGTGKTTFVRAACRELGVEETVASPSFTIGRVYEGRLPVSHIDLFRLESLAGEDPGLLEDYFSSGSVVFIEWPRAAEPELDEGRIALRLRLAHLGGDRRGIEVAGRPELVERLKRVVRLTSIAFDTSLPATAACVVRDDGATFSTPLPSPGRLLEPAAHSQELLPELDRLLKEAETGWDEVTSIAVGVGPGTFTGLRIGVSTARALAQALAIGLRPVSSLEALAEGLAHEGEDFDRPLLSVIDARRKQVFAALYSRQGADRPLEQVWEAMVLDPDALLERIRSLDIAPVCSGDWALESIESLEGVGAKVPPSDSGVHAVNAFHVYRLGARIAPIAPSDVNPVYLRLPDAELSKRRARDLAPGL